MSGTPIYSNCFSAEEQEEWVTVPRRMLSPNYQPHTHESPFAANLSHPSSPETCVPAMTWGVPSEQQQPFYPSPVSPMLDSFSPSLFPDTIPLFSDDLGLELELASRVLEGSAPLDLTGLQSLQSAELFNGLFDPDVPLGFDSVPLSADFADFLAPFESPSPSSSQGLPLSPGSSTSGTGSSPTTTPQTSDLLLCSAPDCFRTFEQSSQLRRHERKHRLPFRCEICGKGHLDKRALSRHLWAKHPEFAQQSNTRSEKVKCDECDYEGRADNVARHKKRHSKARR